MKKSNLMIIIIFVVGVFTPQVAYSNMAAPEDADIGSVVTFETNDEISVLSEVLDITIDGSKAEMVATYRMKNTTNENISIQSMFLSPNVEEAHVVVVANDKSIDYVVDSFGLNYSTEIETNNWEYVVLTDESIASSKEGKTVDTITFQMDFAPNEEYEVTVSYGYQLGGYPDNDFGARRGEIEYYLTPAAMWKDFKSLTINLYLDDNMPVIESSNLEFEKIESRFYQYTSDTLPEENLKITIDENWWQNIWSSLRSPYLSLILTILSPIILVGIAVTIFVIWHVRRKKRRT